MWWRLQPLVVGKLQPYVVEAAAAVFARSALSWRGSVASRHARARAGGADALGGAVGGAARLVDVAEVEASGAEAVVILTLILAVAVAVA